jgi:hypothetical protein
MRLLLDTFVRFLITISLYVGAYSYHVASGLSRDLLGAPPFDFGWEPLNFGVIVMIHLAILFMTGNLFYRAFRIFVLLNCWCDPKGAEKWVAEIDSPELWRKRLALRTIADYLGRDAASSDWPFMWRSAAELEAQVNIVKQLWAARQTLVADCPSQGWLLQRLTRNMKQSFWRLANYRIDLMISRIRESLDQSEPDVETEARPSLGSPLMQEHLPPLQPERLIESMRARITETLQKCAQILNDASSGTLIVDSERPVGELLARLFLEAYQAELLLRMGADRVDPSEIVAADHWPYKGFRLFQEMMEKGGHAVQELLTDLNLMAEEVQAEPMNAELPFMSPDEFVFAMRPHVEKAFEEFVELTNQTKTGLILAAEEAGLCRIFAHLHAEALETGLELRLKRAKSLEGTSRLKKEEVAAPHLRKAASPPLPSPFLSWAAKYRCMRIAGTRFLSGMRETGEGIKPDSTDKPPITSIKADPG